MEHLQTINCLPPTPLPTDLNIVFNNVNTLTYDKLRSLLHGMIAHGTDILCLTDTRIWKQSDILLHRALCKTILGPGSSAHFATAAQHHTTIDRRTYTTAVGGQLIIKGPRITRAANFSSDPSQCGAVATLHIHFGSADLNIVSVYCPTRSTSTDDPNTGSMWDKLSRFLALSRLYSHLNPTDYILEWIARQTQHHHQANHCGTICGGDWNSSWNKPTDTSGSFDSLQEWASPLSLRNPYTVLNKPPEPTLYRPTDERAISIIDHVLYRGPVITPVSIHVDHSSIWMVSDHRPLVFTFSLYGWNKPYTRRKLRRHVHPDRKPDITRPCPNQDKREALRLQRYREHISSRLPLPSPNPTLTTAQAYIARLTTTAVHAARTTQTRTTRGPHGWSPEVVVLTLAKSTLIEIRRRLSGLSGRQQWTTHTQVTSGIRHLCDLWKGHLSDMARSKAQLTHLLDLTDKGPDYWQEIPPLFLYTDLTTEIKQLGKLLHGRRRAELRVTLHKIDSTRSRKRAGGTHLSECKRLLDRATPHWDMDELIDNTGNLHINGRTICEVATSHFNDWHSRKPTATFGFHDPTCDHGLLLTDLNYFLLHHQSTGIPSPLLTRIWTSLNAPLARTAATTLINPLLQADIRAISETPTYTDFITALRAMPTKSAAGPSGLTYNMIASLPTDHLLALYQHLVILWEHRSTLPAWKWRELSPLPKLLENITINDIRPLTLIETACKVWVSIIINKIKHLWLEHNILHDSQHAYTAVRGVDTVHPQHRNVLEESRETCTSLFYTSWDIKRAFDRVAKPILTASWIRAGVPADIAAYLVAFDTDGYTYIGTPYTRISKCVERNDRLMRRS